MQCFRCFKGYLAHALPNWVKNREKFALRCDELSIFAVTTLIPQVYEEEKEKKIIGMLIHEVLEKNYNAHQYILIGDEESTQEVKSTISYQLQKPILRTWYNIFNKSGSENSNIQVVNDIKKIDKILEQTECFNVMICSSVGADDSNSTFCLPTDPTKSNAKMRIILVKGMNTTNDQVMASLDNLHKNSSLCDYIDKFPKSLFPKFKGDFSSNIASFFFPALLVLLNIRK